MFKIGKDEVKAVQKLAPKNKLKVLSRRKNSRGHTYLVLDDDYDTLRVLKPSWQVYPRHPGGRVPLHLRRSGMIDFKRKENETENQYLWRVGVAIENGSAGLT